MEWLGYLAVAVFGGIMALFGRAKLKRSTKLSDSAVDLARETSERTKAEAEAELAETVKAEAERVERENKALDKGAENVDDRSTSDILGGLGGPRD